MSKYKYFVFFFLCSIPHCFGQTEKIEQMYDVITLANRSYLDSEKNINYLKPLNILVANQSKFHGIDKRHYQSYLDFLNMAYSHVHLKDSMVDNLDRIKISKTTKLYDPIPFLNKEIGDSRIVMLNEAHDVPGHRLFAETLLKPLHKKGFQYLALETLYWSDTLINQRKYPVSYTGYYTKEPYFANFVRSAINEGFKIIPYEQKQGSGDINEREINQANNLIEVLNQNPSAKIFVYAGYSHIKEKSMLEDIKWMAQRIKDSIDLDPFTIDQTTFISDYKDKKPVLLNLGDNVDSVANKFKGVYDVSILNSEKSQNLHYDLGKKAINIELSKDFVNNNNSLILQAYITNEYNESGDKAIPFDQLLLLKGIDNVILYLHPNENYSFIIKDSDNNIILNKKADTNKRVIRL